MDDVVVDLFPYDGGTRSANVWNLHGPTNNPPEPISLITTESGQLVGPQSLGTMTFRRVETGDLNADGLIDAADIDELSAAVRNGTDDLLYDLNDDLTPVGRRYLGDPEAIKRATEKVAGQLSKKD